MKYKEIVRRYKKIIKLREKRKTYEYIGNILNISRQRVQQIISKGFPKEETTNKIRTRIGLDINLSGRDRTREIVRLRDNFSCVDCGKKWNIGERRFDIHHINNLCGKRSTKYDKVSEMDGLVTLCHKCHFNRPEHKSKRKKLTSV